MYATAHAPPQPRRANFGRHEPLPSRLTSFTLFQVYELTACEGTFSLSKLERPQADMRVARCIPQDLAHKLAHASPQDGEPYHVHHDAFGCPEVATHRVFSGFSISTGEMVLRQTYVPGADAYFVEVNPALAQMAPPPPQSQKQQAQKQLVGPQNQSPAPQKPAPQQAQPAPASNPQANRGVGRKPQIATTPSHPKRGPMPSTKPAPEPEPEYVKWGQGEFEQVVQVGRAFYQKHRTTEGQEKGEWLVVERKPKESWESAYPPHALTSRAANPHEIQYARTLEAMTSRTH